MISNRKKKQTNKEIKTPSACENNLACLNAINHNIMFKPICPPTHYPAVTNPFSTRSSVLLTLLTFC